MGTVVKATTGGTPKRGSLSDAQESEQDSGRFATFRCRGDIYRSRRRARERRHRQNC